MLKLAVLLFLAATTAVNSQCFFEDDNAKTMDPAAREMLYNGQMNFTLNLFNTINKAVPDDNIFFSPFSVYHALLLAYFSAGGQTEKSLKESLQISDTLDKVNLLLAYKVDKTSRARNNNSVSYEFTNANKIYVDDHLQVRQCLLDRLSSEIQTLNFHDDPALARDEINKWVSLVTKNNINELIPLDGISPGTKLVLANAAYFKGVWASKFPAEKTKKQAFYVSESRSTFVHFMRQKGNFHFMLNDDLGAQILELPYKGNDISMYILLPPYSQKDGITKIIANLTPERLAAVVDEGYVGREVIVEIPKFTIEKSLALRPILEKLGVGNLFESTLDFSTLSQDKGILFDDAIHKAKIKVDEEGTVAAAATAIFGFRSSRPAEPTTFTANYPFVYVIYERPTNSILFMGVYRDPKK